MFYWAAKNSIFPTDEWRFDKTDLQFSVGSDKEQCIFVEGP